MNPFQYTGREFDPETGIYEYRYRYYDQSAGRFLGEDPLRFRATVDFYPYALNNPIRWSDPDGREISWGGIYNSFNNAMNALSWLNCFIFAKPCMQNLYPGTTAQRNDPSMMDPNNLNLGFSNGSDLIKNYCKGDTNCAKALCQCAKLAVTNPLNPPGWIIQILGPDPCHQK